LAKNLVYFGLYRRHLLGELQSAVLRLHVVRLSIRQWRWWIMISFDHTVWKFGNQVHGQLAQHLRSS